MSECKRCGDEVGDAKWCRKCFMVLVGVLIASGRLPKAREKV